MMMMKMMKRSRWRRMNGRRKAVPLRLPHLFCRPVLVALPSLSLPHSSLLLHCSFSVSSEKPNLRFPLPNELCNLTSAVLHVLIALTEQNNKTTKKEKIKNQMEQKH